MDGASVQEFTLTNLALNKGYHCKLKNTFMSDISKIEGKVLGKQVSYPQAYSPEILVAVPRHFNREQYNIEDKALPFVGCDVWHAYEFSFLTQKGLPVTRLLKIVYPSDSISIVESKSLKLYLNSFNMSEYGNSVEEGIDEVKKIILKDLSKLLECTIQIEIFNSSTKISGLDFKDYSLLENIQGIENIDFKHFTESPELLKRKTHPSSTLLQTATHLLRSNCKITSQPDWGSVFIHIKSNFSINPIDLLQYLVSFRNENHFHEEVCEMIYKRLWDIFNPEELMVSCIYTRRGGIDICPSRASKYDLLPKNLTNVNILSPKLLRQ
jgi:7-cyano-7-deazaguanine reductase